MDASRCKKILSKEYQRIHFDNYCISKEAIDEGNICLDKMSDPWFLDADYKAMALIEGKNIKA